MVQFYNARRKVSARTTSTINLTIDSLDVFGQGVAKLGGKTYFIADGLPTEQVTVNVVEEKKQYAKGRVIKHHTISPDRVKPRCPHITLCGGCQQQHISSPLQRLSKSVALSHLFSKGMGSQPVQSEPLFGQEYHYRRRARIGLQYQAKSGHLLMGFRQHHSNELVEIQNCPVLCEPLDQLLIPLRECLSRLSIVSKLGHLELVLADNGPLLVLRHLVPLQQQDKQTLIAFAQRQQLAIFLVNNQQQCEKLIGDVPYYKLKNLQFFFDPQGFIQVNAQVNTLMVEKALEWLDIQPQDRILDLFCGVGNFTLPIAQQAAQVIGIEGVAELVSQAQCNAQYNRLDNVEFYHANLAEQTQYQPWLKGGFDKVLLDPARAGAQEVMPVIAQLGAKRIVYVSCNPVTLVRDSKLLVELGYHLIELTMLDMFPQTGHLESMALFVKGDK